MSEEKEVTTIRIPKVTRKHLTIGTVAMLVLGGGSLGGLKLDQLIEIKSALASSASLTAEVAARETADISESEERKAADLAEATVRAAADLEEQQSRVARDIELETQLSEVRAKQEAIYRMTRQVCRKARAGRCD